MNTDTINKLERKIYELEKKQELLLIGIDRLLEKQGINIEDNLELFAISAKFSYEELEKFKEFLVQSSIKLHNEKLSKLQFIEEYNKNFENKKLLLTKLMNIINKSDEFQGLCCLFFDKK